MAETRLLLVLACSSLLLPIPAIAAQADFLPGTRHTCSLHLATGQQYILQVRTFRWKKSKDEIYTTVSAYYAPGSGELLWRGSDYTPDGYLEYGKNESNPNCNDVRRETLQLRDGEWVDFWAVDSNLWIFHSNLRFPSIEDGWRYVLKHPNESSSTLSGKWVVWIKLDDVLGSDFFHRPERLRYNAAPYMFKPPTDVKKVGSTWELQVQGTDDQALILLDKHFRVVKVSKTSSNRR